MLIDDKFLKRITSKNGTLSGDQRRLLSKVLPDTARTADAIRKALVGQEIGDRKAEQLRLLRQWGSRVNKSNGRAYRSKRGYG